MWHTITGTAKIEHVPERQLSVLYASFKSTDGCGSMMLTRALYSARSRRTIKRAGLISIIEKQQPIDDLTDRVEELEGPAIDAGGAQRARQQPRSAGRNHHGRERINHLRKREKNANDVTCQGTLDRLPEVLCSTTSLFPRDLPRNLCDRDSFPIARDRQQQISTDQKSPLTAR